VVMIAFVVTYGKLLIKARESMMLEQKVDRLVKRNNKMDEIIRDMAQIKTMDVKIRKMLGVELNEDSSRAVSEIQIPDLRDREIVDQQARMLKATPVFWPLRGYITRGFEIGVGKSSDEYHPGVDIAVERGTPVKAAASGYVIKAGWDNIYGYQVIIDHGYGMKTLYGHNERLVVFENETVSRGQTIAYSGNSGKSSAPHLHFGVIRNNSPVDPLDYLPR
jgi:murein DD-endopeptidase MepM/ murein hydrolase activator NlpD